MLSLMKKDSPSAKQTKTVHDRTSLLTEKMIGITDNMYLSSH